MKKMPALQLFGLLVSELAKYYEGPSSYPKELVNLHNRFWPDSPIKEDEIDWEQ
jgi:hypothetical protein